MNLPIIRLEVEGMKYAIMTALQEHALKMDSDIKEAVEKYCTEENLARVIKNAAEQQLENAIKEEVSNFFRFGNGRKAVAEAVKESLLNNKTYTPLDEI